LQFFQRHIRLRGDFVPEQRPLGLLQAGDRAATVPRGQVLPRPMPAEHLFDERGADAKQCADFRNRPVPVFDRVHYTDP